MRPCVSHLPLPPEQSPTATCAIVARSVPGGTRAGRHVGVPSTAARRRETGEIQEGANTWSGHLEPNGLPASWAWAEGVWKEKGKADGKKCACPLVHPRRQTVFRQRDRGVHVDMLVGPRKAQVVGRVKTICFYAAQKDQQTATKIVEREAARTDVVTGGGVCQLSVLISFVVLRMVRQHLNVQVLCGYYSFFQVGWSGRANMRWTREGWGRMVCGEREHEEAERHEECAKLLGTHFHVGRHSAARNGRSCAPIT